MLHIDKDGAWRLCVRTAFETHAHTPFECAGPDGRLLHRMRIRFDLSRVLPIIADHRSRTLLSLSLAAPGAADSAGDSKSARPASSSSSPPQLLLSVYSQPALPSPPLASAVSSALHAEMHKARQAAAENASASSTSSATASRESKQLEVKHAAMFDALVEEELLIMTLVLVRGFIVGSGESANSESCAGSSATRMRMCARPSLPRRKRPRRPCWHGTHQTRLLLRRTCFAPAGCTRTRSLRRKVDRRRRIPRPATTPSRPRCCSAPCCARTR